MGDGTMKKGFGSGAERTLFIGIMIWKNSIDHGGEYPVRCSDFQPLYYLNPSVNCHYLLRSGNMRK